MDSCHPPRPHKTVQFHCPLPENGPNLFHIRMYVQQFWELLKESSPGFICSKFFSMSSSKDPESTPLHPLHLPPEVAVQLCKLLQHYLRLILCHHRLLEVVHTQVLRDDGEGGVHGLRVEFHLGSTGVMYCRKEVSYFRVLVFQQLCIELHLRPDRGYELLP